MQEQVPGSDRSPPVGFRGRGVNAGAVTIDRDRVEHSVRVVAAIASKTRLKIDLHRVAHLTCKIVPVVMDGCGLGRSCCAALPCGRRLSQLTYEL